MSTNIIAGYQIIERVYESSRSLIYRGKKENEEKTVILKILNEEYPTPSARARFKLEYEIINQLNTEGVIKAYSLEKYHNTLVMILEDFGGESLKNLLIFNKLNVFKFLVLALQIVNALGEIHQKNIIHKDINPYNILYDKNNKSIKIIDFGIGTIDNQEENTPLNNTNFIAGTLAYISPEQTGRMNRSIDYRTDFYSLGVTFYEMLTNKLPYNTTDPIDLVHSHIAKKPISPAEINPTIPLPVANIIMKLLAKNPEERYQSIVGIKADLQSCLNQ
ncbi:MAG TPA: serine/threonine-protein kinase, partial [Allocoleopsis sp.]